MIKKQTWVVVLSLAVLIGFSFYLNNQKKAEAEKATPTPGSTVLFNTSEGQPTSIEIKTASAESVKVALNPNKAWEMESPIKADANQSTVEAAATQLTALTTAGEVNGDPAIFGLDKPAYIITAEFSSGKKHTLEIGDHTPTNSGYYVRMDNGKSLIVDLGGIDALTNLASFPPYLNTPTPSALPPTATPNALDSGLTATPGP